MAARITSTPTKDKPPAHHWRCTLCGRSGAVEGIGVEIQHAAARQHRDISEWCHDENGGDFIRFDQEGEYPD